MPTLNELPGPPRASLDAMLAFAWDAEVFVSADAMAATGLTRSTAIDALDELIEIGLLSELPNARAVGEYSKGRPSRRFKLRADAAVIVGIDAGRSHLTTTIADLRGVPLGRRATELDATHDSPAERREAVAAAIDSALHATGHGRESVLAVCVGVPAPVNARGVSPHHPDGFWQRMNPDLQELLERWVPIVRVENDASLAAVAEGSVGAAVGFDNYVALLSGDRFGAGVVIDGHLLRGAHGGVGEMVAFDYVGGVGTANGMGIRLTEWVRDAAASGDIPPGHPLTALPSEQLTGRAVLELAKTGDAWARTVVERAGEVLARVAAVFASMYDPARIIISGAVAAGLDEVVEVAQASLPRQADLPAPELVLSSLGGEAVVTGAVAGAVEAAKARVLHLDRDFTLPRREAV